MNDAIRIEQKFSRAGNVRTFRPGAAMQYVVTTNDPGVRIGQEWKCVAQPLRLASVNLWGINADADDTDAACVEFRKPVLETPQLGVAERSPKTTIENQHRTA